MMIPPPDKEACCEQRLVLFLYEAEKDFRDIASKGSKPVPLVNSEGKPLTVFGGQAAAIEWTRDPKAADLFIYPFYLDPLLSGSTDYPRLLDFIHHLPHFAKAAARHVFFLYDDVSFPLGIPSVLFRTSVLNNNCDQNAKALAYDVKDFANDLDFSASAFKYHVSFCGYIASSPVRYELVKAFVTYQGKLRKDINVTYNFHGHIKTLPPEVVARRRQNYLRSLREALFVLCPRGTGINTIRFFEIMSMGRIPVLIADEVLLPFEDETHYDEFVLRIAENDVAQAPDIIMALLQTSPFDALIKRCLLSRLTWQQLFSERFHAHRIIQQLRQHHEKLALNDPSRGYRRHPVTKLRDILRENTVQSLKRKDFISAALYCGNFLNTWPEGLIPPEIMERCHAIWNTSDEYKQTIWEKVAALGLQPQR